MQPDNKFLKPKIESIPAELKQFNQWVCWRAEKREGKITKVPYDPKTHRLASSTNPDTWGPFWQAVKESKSNGYNGIGFVVSKDDPYCGWDFDHCVDKHGGINAGVQPMVAKLNSYSEFSPSSTGVRALTKGTLPKTGRKRGHFECYDTGRYFTITGHPVSNSPDEIRECQDEITAVHKEIFGSQKKKRESTKTQHVEEKEIPPVLDKAFNSRHGDRIKALYDGDIGDYPSQSEADLALCSHLAFWFKNDPAAIDQAFRKSGLMRPKWDSKRGDSTYGWQTVEKAIEGDTEVAEERAAIQGEAPVESNEIVQSESEAEPVPDEVKQPGVPEFPHKVMSGLAGYYTQIYGSHLEPPEQFFFMSYLALLGLAVSHKMTLKSQRRYRPNYYIVLLGESGKTRKSTAIEETVDFFEGFFADKAFAVCRGAASGEAVGKKFEENLNVLLYYDELKVFVNKANIQNSTLLTAVNILFESDRYENFKTKDPLIIHGAHLSVIAASTVGTYTDMFSPKYLDIGFNNRLFLVPGHSDKCIPVPAQIPDDEIKFMKKELGQCMAMVDKKPVYDLDPLAADRWDEYYHHLHGINDPFVTRLDTYGLRFMPLLAANDMKSSVDTDTVDKVIMLIDWQHHVREIYDPIDAEGRVARMEEKLRRCGLEKPNWRKWELQRKVNYRRHGVWEFNQGLNNLIDNGEVHRDGKKKLYVFVENDSSK